MDRLESTLLELKVLATGIAILTGGTTILHVILEHFLPGIAPEDYVPLWEVFAATAPMTIGVALVVFVLYYGTGFTSLVLAGGILWLSIVLGNLFGGAIGDVPMDVRWWNFFDPRSWMKILNHYKDLYETRYGIGHFIGGIAIGLYLGYKLTQPSAPGPVAAARPSAPGGE